MYLSDYHTHSRLSFDTHALLSGPTEATVDAGLDELCVTDHFDSLNENGVPVGDYDWAPVVAQHQQALPAARKRLALRLGLELGVPHLNPTAAAVTCARLEADFILGPVHNFSPERGGTDLFFLDSSTVQACYDALDDYFASLALLAVTDFYDVPAHLTYPLRHMQVPATPNRYQNATRAILRTAMEKGRSMRVSTYRGRTPEEWRPILAFYRDCDGEIVIVGSDAHAPADVSRGIRAACVLLWECGFRRVCTYEEHQLVSHTLG